MRYYHFNFALVYCLGIIVLIVTIFAIMNKNHLLQRLLTTSVAVVGLMSNMMFTGVLSDNNAPDISFWRNQSWILLLAGIGCWALQLILLFKNILSKKI